MTSLIQRRTRAGMAESADGAQANAVLGGIHHALGRLEHTEWLTQPVRHVVDLIKDARSANQLDAHGVMIVVENGPCHQ